MPDFREKEIAEKRRRRLERWFKTLTPEQQKLPTRAHLTQLFKEGLIDKDGKITPAGELKLLQLQTLEWMKNHPRK